MEGPFNKNNTSGRSDAFLPREIGLYRKDFNISVEDSDKVVTIEFDGVYMNSDVWINGVHLGNIPQK
ncbi:sugar-binding domain-containing protein [Xylanivirga thermophila]|uniref:sugar-binding domain-containing protein n=1 Tax=Xylanivirga thermophila TaxID=2496273 RepID=UPI0039F49C75